MKKLAAGLALLAQGDASPDAAGRTHRPVARRGHRHLGEGVSSMHRRLPAALAIAAALALVTCGAASAEIFRVSGRVVTCPAGDPIVEMPVTVYFNGVGAGQATTGSAGHWSVDISVSNCDPIVNVITAVLGTQPLIQPYYKASCPSGRHGAPPNCCVQVVRGVACTAWEVQMDDLELRCGVSGAPPCPSTGP